MFAEARLASSHISTVEYRQRCMQLHKGSAWGLLVAPHHALQAKSTHLITLLLSLMRATSWALYAGLLKRRAWGSSGDAVKLCTAKE
jgi:hypothetical protein